MGHVDIYIYIYIYACLIIAAIACHTAISMIWHTKKMSSLVKWGIELKMNWLNWSIPISWGFWFQFNSNSKSFNSIPIQFMTWSEPCMSPYGVIQWVEASHFTSSSTVYSKSYWSWQQNTVKAVQYWPFVGVIHWGLLAQKANNMGTFQIHTKI